MNYIIYNDESFMQFFYSPRLGLCFNSRIGGRWTEPVALHSDVKDGFCVFCDDNGTVHIICSNTNNDILYIIKNKSHWHKYTLSKGNPDISPIEFKLAKACGLLNFFYTAEYKNSIILVHCVLGAEAKPQTLDELSDTSPFFSVNNGKIYYTNSSEILGFKTFSDGKPEDFNEICKNAHMPHSNTINGTEYLLYIKENCIYLNKSKILSEPFATSPIIFTKNSKLVMQWISNNSVHYATSFDNGATWSSPMKFIGNGNKNLLFCIHTEEIPQHFYGNCSKSEPVIFGKSDIFFHVPEASKR